MTSPLLDIPAIFRLSIETYFMLIILSVPTVFLLSWFFKKYIKVDRTRKIATWIALYVGLTGLLFYNISYTPGKDFDTQQWLVDRERRFEMANDIIKNKLLIDKDMHQVKQILGAPTWEGNTLQHNKYINTWAYDMGTGDSGFGLSFHNLFIRFDNNKVVAVEHAKIRD